MTANRETLPRPRDDWKKWAEEVVSYFKNPLPRDAAVMAAPIQLQYLIPGALERAVLSGILMYDPVKALPVVSDGVEFREVGLTKDNVSSNHMTIGGLLVQWGTEVASVASETITFPVPFNDTTAVVIVAAQTHAYPSSIVAASFLMTGTNTEDKFWIAIGPAVP